MFITNSDIHSHETTQSNHLNIPLCHKNIGKISLRYRGAIIWNNVLKSGIPLDQSNMLFKQQLRKQIVYGSIRDKLHLFYLINESQAWTTCCFCPNVTIHGSRTLPKTHHLIKNICLPTFYKLLSPAAPSRTIFVTIPCIPDKEPINHHGFQLPFAPV